MNNFPLLFGLFPLSLGNFWVGSECRKQNAGMGEELQCSLKVKHQANFETTQGGSGVKEAVVLLF